MDTRAAYRELGLEPSASDAELKSAWRRLVATWHPDRNAAAHAEGRMQAINKAYQHIRQVRDGLLEPDDGDEDSPAPASASAAEPAAPEPEAALQVRKVRLSLEEAVLGCTRTVRGHFQTTCNVCLGKGQRVLAKGCSTCNGSGAVRKPSLFGWLWNEESCADCGGDGRQRALCEPCHSSGTQRLAYSRRVRFPAGVRNGHTLSLPRTRQGGVEIALELEVELEPHPLFELDAAGQLRCEMPVNGYAWMAGQWVDLPTPDGMQHMRLNRDALVYRLRGQGFPTAPRGPRGDYLVRLVPVFPTQTDPEQVALLEQLIARSSQRLAADAEQPLGPWQRKLERWSRKAGTGGGADTTEAADSADAKDATDPTGD